MKQFLVFHPFLFAIFPVLFLFAYNIDEVPAADLILPILAVIALTLILLLLFRLITKNYNKIGILTSYFLILFFSYGRIWELIFPTGIGKIYIFTLILGLLWALLFITGAFLVLKSRSNFFSFTKFLNVFAIAMVTISLINISIYEITPINLVPEEIYKEGNGFDSGNLGNLPDIYYIILDSYAREDTLKEVYNYDNSGFINYLTSKGFYVASKSRSNYSYTLVSLPSSLNMEHINYLNDLPRIEADKLKHEMWVNGKVAQFLKSKGYRYIYVHGGLDLKDIEKHTDLYLRYKNVFGLKVTSFMTSLVRATALLPIAAVLRHDARNVRLYAFDALAGIPNYYKEPVFVYADIMCPHGPFIFDRDGNPVKQDEPYQLQDKERYLDQLIFISKKVETLVGEIISKSDVEPIIILQADHGHGSRDLRDIPVDVPYSDSEFTKRLVDERMSIFNAYFLPGKDNRLLYETITPVNSFRIVFNLYFNADYELLKDESYFAHPSYPLKFILVPPEVEKGME